MKKFLTALLISASTTSAMADDTILINRLKNIGAQDVQIQASPVKGLKTVITDQGILYATEDGKYVIQGKMYEINDKGVSDVAGKILLKKLNALESEMIVYPAKNSKYTITVFMDTSCHYCHLLYERLKEYNDLGITLRFLAFPRAGLNNQTARQMESIWTAKDPAFALKEAENGNPPTELKSPEMIKKHYDLGVQFGVRGTPTIVTETGEILGGYLKPQDLLNALKQQ